MTAGLRTVRLYDLEFQDLQHHIDEHREAGGWLTSEIHGGNSLFAAAR